MADQADKLTPAELDRFLAWCQSEAKRAERVRNQMVTLNGRPTVQSERIGVDCGALTIVALKLERMKAGAET